MFENIKAFRRKLVGYNPIFLGWPILLAIIVPNIIQPFWFWRLIACLVVGLTLIAISIYGLVVPEQIFHDLHSELTGTKRYLFSLLFTAMWIAAISLALYLFVLSSGSDLYRVIRNPHQALTSQTLQFTKTEYSGGVSPWFMYQQLYTSDQTEYTLYFDFQAFGSGTYNILYSPYTKIIYGISPVQ